MNIEVLLLIIIGLLILIFFALLYIALSNNGVLAGFEQVVEEIRDRKGSRNTDLGDMLDSQEYEKALSEIDKRIDSMGEQSTLLWYKGKALYYLERWNDSHEVFSRAIELEPSFREQLKSYMELLEHKLGEAHNQ